ncbi:hypothetical protein E2542_SST04036 [Spatholobus suberectus]|nr:hypothetical protein E2542_SST04036 [Spatholobus suberectus]
MKSSRSLSYGVDATSAIFVGRIGNLRWECDGGARRWRWEWTWVVNHQLRRLPAQSKLPKITLVVVIRFDNLLKCTAKLSLDQMEISLLKWCHTYFEHLPTDKTGHASRLTVSRALTSEWGNCKEGNRVGTPW